jgi:hypothetical protein
VGEIEREIRKKERKRERETNQNNKAMICRDIAPLYQLVREGIFSPVLLERQRTIFFKEGEKVSFKGNLACQTIFFANRLEFNEA